MNPGDCVDVVISAEEDGKMKIKRVRVLSVAVDKTKKERKAVMLRTWRGAVLVDAPNSQKYDRKR